MTPAGTSNELDVQNEWEENTHTHISGSVLCIPGTVVFCVYHISGYVLCIPGTVVFCLYHTSGSVLCIPGTVVYCVLLCIQCVVQYCPKYCFMWCIMLSFSHKLCTVICLVPGINHSFLYGIVYSILYSIACAPMCVCVSCHPIYFGRLTCGRTSRGHTGGRSYSISPPSFCGACLYFLSREEFSRPFPSLTVTLNFVHP